MTYVSDRVYKSVVKKANEIYEEAKLKNSSLRQVDCFTALLYNARRAVDLNKSATKFVLHKKGLNSANSGHNSSNKDA